MGVFNRLNNTASGISLDNNGDIPDTNIAPSIARDSELPAVGNGTLTVNSGTSLTGSGTFTANQTGNTTITLSHADTSSQGSVNNSGTNFIHLVM